LEPLTAVGIAFVWICSSTEIASTLRACISMEVSSVLGQLVGAELKSFYCAHTGCIQAGDYTSSGGTLMKGSHLTVNKLRDEHHKNKCNSSWHSLFGS
jgi:hypothetical protein